MKTIDVLLQGPRHASTLVSLDVGSRLTFFTNGPIFGIHLRVGLPHGLNGRFAMGSTGLFLAVASRPASTLWSWLYVWLLGLVAVLLVCGVVLLEQLTNRWLALGLVLTS